MNCSAATLNYLMNYSPNSPPKDSSATIQELDQLPEEMNPQIGSGYTSGLSKSEHQWVSI